MGKIGRAIAGSFWPPGWRSAVAPPFSTATKIVKLHKYGSVEFSFGAANAGKTVIIEGAAKINGVWGSFSALTLRVADSNGNVFWHYRSASVAWLSTYGNLGGVHTNSVQARWMK